MDSKEIVLSVFATVFKVVLAIIVIMLVYKWSLSAYEYGERVFNEPPVSSGEGRDVTVTVAEGDTVREIGEMLQDKGLIRDAKLFRLQEMLSEYKDKLKPGTYELNTSMRTEEMLAILSAGKAAEEE